jgi:hypothetical protein
MDRASVRGQGSPRLRDALLVRAGRQLNLAFHSFETRHAPNRRR